MSIDPVNETVTLDKDKTIEVAKIIKNESRLIKYVDSLHAEIRALNDSVQSITKKYRNTLDKIEFLNSEKSILSNKVEDLNKKQLEWERDKSHTGLYAISSFGTDLSGFYSSLVGFTYVGNKMIIQAGIDPLINPEINKQLTYNIGLGFKIF